MIRYPIFYQLEQWRREQDLAEREYLRGLVFTDDELERYIERVVAINDRVDAYLGRTH